MQDQKSWPDKPQAAGAASPCGCAAAVAYQGVQQQAAGSSTACGGVITSSAAGIQQQHTPCGLRRQSQSGNTAYAAAVARVLQLPHTTCTSGVCKGTCKTQATAAANADRLGRHLCTCMYPRLAAQCLWLYPPPLFRLAACMYLHPTLTPPAPTRTPQESSGDLAAGKPMQPSSRDPTSPLGLKARTVVQTTIEVEEAANGTCSVLSVKTRDRPGLLVDIVQVGADTEGCLAGCRGDGWTGGRLHSCHSQPCSPPPCRPCCSPSAHAAHPAELKGNTK
jgi:hypothetical protein